MNQILLHLQTPVSSQVSADGSRQSVGRIGSACERAETLDHAVPFEADGNDVSREHELDEGFKKWFSLVLGICK